MPKHKAILRILISIFLLSSLPPSIKSCGMEFAGKMESKYLSRLDFTEPFESHYRRLQSTCSTCLKFKFDMSVLDSHFQDGKYSDAVTKIKGLLEDPETVNLLNSFLVRNEQSLYDLSEEDGSSKLCYGYPFDRDLRAQQTDWDLFVIPIIDEKLPQGKMYTKVCFQDVINLKPIAGIMAFSNTILELPNGSDAKKTKLRNYHFNMLLHHIIHLIIFHEKLLNQVWNTSTSTSSSILRDMTWQNLPNKGIRSTRVSNVVKLYYNCPSAQTLTVPLEDQGGDGIAVRHWESSLLMGDIMTAVDNFEETYISPMTVELINSSGWYTAYPKNKGEKRFVYGKYEGCDFFNGIFVKDDLPSFYAHCNKPNSRGCTPNLGGIGTCNIKTDKLKFSDETAKYSLFNLFTKAGDYYLNNFTPYYVPTSFTSVVGDYITNMYTDSCRDATKSKTSTITNVFGTMDLQYKDQDGFDVALNSACMYHNLQDPDPSVTTTPDLSLKPECFTFVCDHVNFSVSVCTNKDCTERSKCQSTPASGQFRGTPLLVRVDTEDIGGYVICPPFNVLCGGIKNSLYESIVADTPVLKDENYDTAVSQTSMTIKGGLSPCCYPNQTDNCLMWNHCMNQDEYAKNNMLCCTSDNKTNCSNLPFCITNSNIPCALPKYYRYTSLYNYPECHYPLPKCAGKWKQESGTCRNGFDPYAIDLPFVRCCIRNVLTSYCSFTNIGYCSKYKNFVDPCSGAGDSTCYKSGLTQAGIKKMCTTDLEVNCYKPPILAKCQDEYITKEISCSNAYNSIKPLAEQGKLKYALEFDISIHLICSNVLVDNCIDAAFTIQTNSKIAEKTYMKCNANLLEDCVMSLTVNYNLPYGIFTPYYCCTDSNGLYDSFKYCIPQTDPLCTGVLRSRHVPVLRLCDSIVTVMCWKALTGAPANPRYTHVGLFDNTIIVNYSCDDSDENTKKCCSKPPNLGRLLRRHLANQNQDPLCPYGTTGTTCREICEFGCDSFGQPDCADNCTPICHNIPTFDPNSMTCAPNCRQLCGDYDQCPQCGFSDCTCVPVCKNGDSCGGVPECKKRCGLLFHLACVPNCYPRDPDPVCVPTDASQRLYKESDLCLNNGNKSGCFTFEPRCCRVGENQGYGPGTDNCFFKTQRPNCKFEYIACCPEGVTDGCIIGDGTPDNPCHKFILPCCISPFLVDKCVLNTSGKPSRYCFNLETNVYLKTKKPIVEGSPVIACCLNGNDYNCLQSVAGTTSLMVGCEPINQSIKPVNSELSDILYCCETGIREVNCGFPKVGDFVIGYVGMPVCNPYFKENMPDCGGELGITRNCNPKQISRVIGSKWQSNYVPYTTDMFIPCCRHLDDTNCMNAPFCIIPPCCDATVTTKPEYNTECVDLDPPRCHRKPPCCIKGPNSPADCSTHLDCFPPLPMCSPLRTDSCVYHINAYTLPNNYKPPVWCTTKVQSLTETCNKPTILFRDKCLQLDAGKLPPKADLFGLTTGYYSNPDEVDSLFCMPLYKPFPIYPPNCQSTQTNNSPSNCKFYQGYSAALAEKRLPCCTDTIKTDCFYRPPGDTTYIQCYEAYAPLPCCYQNVTTNCSVRPDCIKGIPCCSPIQQIDPCSTNAATCVPAAPCCTDEYNIINKCHNLANCYAPDHCSYPVPPANCIPKMKCCTAIDRTDCYNLSDCVTPKVICDENRGDPENFIISDDIPCVKIDSSGNYIEAESGWKKGTDPMPFYFEILPCCYDNKPPLCRYDPHFCIPRYRCCKKRDTLIFEEVCTNLGNCHVPGPCKTVEFNVPGVHDTTEFCYPPLPCCDDSDCANVIKDPAHADYIAPTSPLADGKCGLKRILCDGECYPPPPECEPNPVKCIFGKADSKEQTENGPFPCCTEKLVEYCSKLRNCIPAGPCCETNNMTYLVYGNLLNEGTYHVVNNCSEFPVNCYRARPCCKTKIPANPPDCNVNEITNAEALVKNAEFNLLSPNELKIAREKNLIHTCIATEDKLEYPCCSVEDPEFMTECHSLSNCVKPKKCLTDRYGNEYKIAFGTTIPGVDNVKNCYIPRQCCSRLLNEEQSLGCSDDPLYCVPVAAPCCGTGRLGDVVWNECHSLPNCIMPQPCCISGAFDLQRSSRTPESYPPHCNRLNNCYPPIPCCDVTSEIIKKVDAPEIDCPFTARYCASPPTDCIDKGPENYSYEYVVQGQRLAVADQGELYKEGDVITGVPPTCIPSLRCCDEEVSILCHNLSNCHLQHECCTIVYSDCNDEYTTCNEIDTFNYQCTYAKDHPHCTRGKSCCYNPNVTLTPGEDDCQENEEIPDGSLEYVATDVSNCIRQQICCSPTLLTYCSKEINCYPPALHIINDDYRLSDGDANDPPFINSYVVSPCCDYGVDTTISKPCIKEKEYCLEPRECCDATRQEECVNPPFYHNCKPFSPRCVNNPTPAVCDPELPTTDPDYEASIGSYLMEGCTNLDNTWTPRPCQEGEQQDEDLCIDPQPCCTESMTTGCHNLCNCIERKRRCIPGKYEEANGNDCSDSANSFIPIPCCNNKLVSACRNKIPDCDPSDSDCDCVDPLPCCVQDKDGNQVYHPCHNLKNCQPEKPCCMFQDTTVPLEADGITPTVFTSILEKEGCRMKTNPCIEQTDDQCFLVDPPSPAGCSTDINDCISRRICCSYPANKNLIPGLECCDDSILTNSCAYSGETKICANRQLPCCDEDGNPAGCTIDTRKCQRYLPCCVGDNTPEGCSTDVYKCLDYKPQCDYTDYPLIKYNSCSISRQNCISKPQICCSIKEEPIGCNWELQTDPSTILYALETFLCAFHLNPPSYEEIETLDSEINDEFSNAGECRKRPCCISDIPNVPYGCIFNSLACESYQPCCITDDEEDGPEGCSLEDTCVPYKPPCTQYRVPVNCSVDSDRCLPLLPCCSDSLKENCVSPNLHQYVDSIKYDGTIENRYCVPESPQCTQDYRMADCTVFSNSYPPIPCCEAGSPLVEPLCSNDKDRCIQPEGCCTPELIEEFGDFNRPCHDLANCIIARPRCIDGVYEIDCDDQDLPNSYDPVPCCSYYQEVEVNGVLQDKLFVWLDGVDDDAENPNYCIYEETCILPLPCCTEGYVLREVESEGLPIQLCHNLKNCQEAKPNCSSFFKRKDCNTDPSLPNRFDPMACCDDGLQYRTCIDNIPSLCTCKSRDATPPGCIEPGPCCNEETTEDCDTLPNCLKPLPLCVKGQFFISSRCTNSTVNSYIPRPCICENPADPSSCDYSERCIEKMPCCPDPDTWDPVLQFGYECHNLGSNYCYPIQHCCTLEKLGKPNDIMLIDSCSLQENCIIPVACCDEYDSGTIRCCSSSDLPRCQLIMDAGQIPDVTNCCWDDSPYDCCIEDTRRCIGNVQCCDSMANPRDCSYLYNCIRPPPVLFAPLVRNPESSLVAKIPHQGENNEIKISPLQSVGFEKQLNSFQTNEVNILHNEQNESEKLTEMNILQDDHNILESSNVVSNNDFLFSPEGFSQNSNPIGFMDNENNPVSYFPAQNVNFDELMIENAQDGQQQISRSVERANRLELDSNVYLTGGFLKTWTGAIGVLLTCLIIS